MPATMTSALTPIALSGLGVILCLQSALHEVPGVSNSDLRITSRPSTCSAPRLIARVQRLADAPRPAGGYPLQWHAEAMHVGDLTAVAMTVLRSTGPAR